jgi:hypothetical protein
VMLRRPRARRTAAWRAWWSSRRLNSASLIALSSRSRPRNWVRSTRVRATDVTGIPRSTVRSSGCSRRSVHPEPGASPVPPRQHVHARAEQVVDVPEGGRVEMAQRGVRTARHHGRHPSRLARAGAVPDGVDARVHSIQPAASDARTDPIVRQPELQQLRSAHDPMLPRRELAHLPPNWRIDSALQAQSMRHPARVAGFSLRRGDPCNGLGTHGRRGRERR